MKEILQHLSEKFIPFWRSMYDSRGGFFGEHANGIIKKDSNRSTVMHLKMLWFFSRAFQAFKDPSLKAIADHAYKYVTERMVDPMYGGFYYSLRPDAYPSDTTKHANVFSCGLHAFTAYFEITKDYAVLKNAFEAFNTLEFRCKREMGYHEQFDGKFLPTPNTKMCDAPNATRHLKTMLHIMEAYTDFYLCTKNEDVKKALVYIYELVKFRVLDAEENSLDVFMDDALDTEYEVIDAGLNMHGSWVLTNASVALGIFTREEASIVKKIVDKTVGECFDGEAMGYRRYGKKVDSDKLSWVQAESVIGLLNVFTITKQEPYLDMAKAIWHYAKHNLVVNGSWYWGKTKAGKLIEKPQSAESKGPYHEGRMLLEILKRGINIGI